MNITVILPTKQNTELENSIRAQMDVSDDIEVFDAPRYPARKIDEIIRKSYNSTILIINPISKILINNFIDDIKAFTKKGIHLRRYDEDINEGLIAGNFSDFRKDDSIWFLKDMYKGTLRDYGASMNFDTVIRTIIRQYHSNVYVSVKRKSADYDEIMRLKKEEEERKMKDMLQDELDEIWERNKLLESMKGERESAIEEHRKEISKLKYIKKFNRPIPMAKAPLPSFPKPEKAAYQVNSEQFSQPKIVSIYDKSVNISEIMLED